MRINVFADVETVAREAARFIAAEARRSVQTRGRFVAALSGGTTPWNMLHAMALEVVPWDNVHVLQVDERVAPAGDEARNLVHLKACLLKHTPMRERQIYAMPVENADLSVAALRYAKTLGKLAGMPSVLDLIHLGLGADGHTASLIPGDPVLEVNDVDVAVTTCYQGRSRLTLTYPVLNRARQLLWLVTGEAKAAMLRRLLAADQSIPAGRVNPERAVVFADKAAAGETA